MYAPPSSLSYANLAADIAEGRFRRFPRIVRNASGLSAILNTTMLSTLDKRCVQQQLDKHDISGVRRRAYFTFSREIKGRKVQTRDDIDLRNSATASAIT